jgi:hypothetical protein
MVSTYPKLGMFWWVIRTAIFFTLLSTPKKEFLLLNFDVRTSRFVVGFLLNLLTCQYLGFSLLRFENHVGRTFGDG